MERIKVISSTLTSTGYIVQSSILELEFVTGAVYRYYNVPVPVYTELLAAPSKGSFFNEFIKDRYRFRKIRD
jgi:hypothetical protein